MSKSSKLQEASLYVLATPIGNLGDISLRAQETLSTAWRIYAEDTRHALNLLRHLHINKPLRSLHAHNEKSRCQEVIDALCAGHSVVLLSDAGTPVISDPGVLLIDAVHAAGYRVSPVAGPSALTAALSVAGFVADHGHVLFMGFLPTRGKSRTLSLQNIHQATCVVVLFEAPHRLVQTLQALSHAQPQRLACVCRELTKLHEEVKRGSLSQLLQWAMEQTLQGEITLVLAGQSHTTTVHETAHIDAAILRCFAQGMRAKETAVAISTVLEISKRAVYERCLHLQPDL